MDEMWMERLSAAVVALEAVVAKHDLAAAEEGVERIVATAISEREEELEAKLVEAEATIAEMRASQVGSGGRKTAVTVQARGGEGFAVAALDGALGSLSIEQRIAVKAEMLRSGLLR